MGDIAINMNNSVERAFKIIEVMAKSDGPCELKAIAKQTELPASTAYRFLQSLMKLQYVKQDENQRYFLTFKVVELANHVRRQSNLITIGQPHLKELSLKCGESAFMAVEENMTALYVCSIEGPALTVKTFQRIGHQAPLHGTGVGKILLSDMTDEEIKRYAETTGLKKYTEKTITSLNGLLAEINKIRKQGYAIDDEECELGAKCVAAPVRDYTGKIVAAISASGPTVRITDEKCAEMIKATIETANQISKSLGYNNIM
ncbi:IclR family transcriptional regulator [Mahella sp.]|uniref:IclR family transcriptional regulator n=1 Tax=Mahella sp. TaxID=2798721 RepID=UPI0025C57F14|nr:IclR family transcriptional regulator [Mahella sp.]MBZ4665988.1 IclR family transcriptional regulator [Mahella sp.]MDK2902496.1 hypothetical protein [Clostridiales bacterium]